MRDVFSVSGQDRSFPENGDGSDFLRHFAQSFVGLYRLCEAAALFEAIHLPPGTFSGMRWSVWSEKANIKHGKVVLARFALQRVGSLRRERAT
jgi:hypothetical protein